MPTCAVILPAFNEEANIGNLLENLTGSAKNVSWPLLPIVVDDGSKDSTVALARKAGAKIGVEVIEHKQNQGLGAALRTGLDFAVSHLNDDDVVVLMDADNSHSPEHIQEMLLAIAEGADVVIASRYAHGGKEIGLSLHRKLGSRMVSTVLAGAFKLRSARDYTCGFRAYRVSTLRRGFEVYGANLVKENSFVCMAELLVKLASVGAKISEIPLILRYDLKGGASKMNIPKTLWRYVHFIVSERRGIRRYAKRSQRELRAKV